jgi:hypothetical protein
MLQVGIAAPKSPAAAGSGENKPMATDRAIEGRDLLLDQVEDATSDIEIGQDPRCGCGTLRALTVGKP